MKQLSPSPEAAAQLLGIPVAEVRRLIAKRLQQRPHSVEPSLLLACRKISGAR